MAKLTETMKKIVEDHKLGYVATVCEDGTPNLSPKGTCLVLDGNHIMFGEIRSPKTLKNIRNRPSMEINFVDPFTRKGFRAKGVATFLQRGSEAFDELIGRFAQWGELTQKINGIVKLKIDYAAPLVSPAYDMGAKEEQLVAHWSNHFSNIHKR